MAISFNKFDAFVAALAHKLHDLEDDTLKVALSNTAPDANDAVLADITEIANGNGYTTGGQAVTVSSSGQTSGVYKLVISDPTWTGTGAGMAQFRYLILYNDTASNDELIGWYDRGAGLTLAVGDSYTADFDATNGVLTIE